MRLVLINQYFPPDDAPTGLMLEAVAEALAAGGHEITVLCSFGGYTKDRRVKDPLLARKSRPDAHVECTRMPLPHAGSTSRPRVLRVGASSFGRGSFVGKILDYAGFYLGVAAWLSMPLNQYDRVVALTTPPYLSVLARCFTRFRGGDHAHWVMDLYPDVMAAHGMLRADGLISRILGRLTRWGFGGTRSRCVLSLGPDMARRVGGYLAGDSRSAWVPLWGTAEAHDHTPQPAETLHVEGKPVVLMYSGNMGLGHRFGEFLAAAVRCGDGFRWRFHGDGKRRGEIEEFIRHHPGSPIQLGGYVPRAALASHLASADVHIASLDPAWAGCMVPSKLQGIFATGRPILFVGPEDCAMAEWIHSSGGGWVIPPGDQAAMDAALAQVAQPEIRRQRGVSALAFARCHFDRETNSRRIAALLAASAS